MIIDWDVKEVKEQSEFSLYLNSFGTSKINVIKTVRNLFSLGLKESKELVESSPVLLKENLSQEDVNHFKSELEKAGASLEVK